MDVCAHLVLSRRQAREAAPQFRKAGFPLAFQGVSFFAELEDPKLNKLKKDVPDSAIREFSPAQHRTFRKARGHGNVRDDIHLYEAAAMTGKVVVTSDENLKDRAGDILDATGVTTLAPEDT